jgi:orotidine-5'-phosphate decarboxylase
MRHGDQERAAQRENRLAEQDDDRQVPHQPAAAPRRSPLLRRPESLRSIPSPYRFLRPSGPGDGQTGRRPDGGRDTSPGGQAGPDEGTTAGPGGDTLTGPGRGVTAGPGGDTVTGPGGGTAARPGAGTVTGPGRDAEAGREGARGVRDPAGNLDPEAECAPEAAGGPEADLSRETGRGGEAGRGQRAGHGAEDRSTEDRSDGGAAGRTRPSTPGSTPGSTAAELRELIELSDLLAELAGLVHDLGALIIGLMTAAAGAGDRQVRAFAIPPEVAELAQAHQELKAEQQALSARFQAPGSLKERAALRGSLAALTERATRAVAAAAAAVVPQEAYEKPCAPPSPGASSEGDTPPGEPGSPGTQPTTEPSREETGVQRLAPVAVALDAPDIDVAAHWATLVTPYVSTVKIGLELYLRYGPAVVATVRGGSGVRIFLDLKLHDIPNTVAGAARAVAKLRPEILTVHAAGGADMIKAAVEAAPDTIVAGVTLLTSIGDKDLIELGVEGSVSDAVRRMAALAVSAGARGLVCSPQEVAAVRAEVGPDILLITPGIRPSGATSDDQARVATPEEALKAGADLLVIGRPITKSPDPGAAAAAIAVSLRRAVPAG